MHTTFRGNFAQRLASPHGIAPFTVQAFPELLSNRLRKSGGFTLIELLVVVALLAILASVTVMSLDSTRASAEIDATKFEMAEIRKALLQFKYDVRHFPDAEDEIIAPADRIALLRNCEPADDDGCTPWDPDLKRGWNGPYLMSGRVNKSPTDAGYYPNAMKDPWHDSVKRPGNYYRLEDPASDTPGTGTARLVSFGQNGVYEGDHATDLCQKKDDASDDIVVCLVQ